MQLGATWGGEKIHTWKPKKNTGATIAATKSTKKTQIVDQ